MQIRNRNRSRRSRRGLALMYATFAAFVAAASVAVFFEVARRSERAANARRQHTEASYMADGAVESAKQRIAWTMANYLPAVQEGTIEVGGETADWSASPNGFEVVRTDPAGVQTTVTGFRVDGESTSGRNRAHMHRAVNAEATPLFQFAVFYANDDLEINPGPDMTLRGRVHTNGDLYLSPGATLVCDTNYVRAVGRIHRGRKDDPSASGGTLRVRRFVDDPFDPSAPSEFVEMYSRPQMAGFGIGTTSGYDSLFMGYDHEGDGDYYGPDDWLPFSQGALEMWSAPEGSGMHGNTVLTGDHGLGQAVTPGIESISMYEENAGGNYVLDGTTGRYVEVAAGTGTHAPGYFHDQADLSLIADDDGTWRAFDGDGDDITYLVQAAGAVTVTGLYDARQANDGAGNTPVLSVDLAKLGASGVWPDNGLVYAAHYGMGTGRDAKGVLLHSGAELASALTVVTEGAMYVKGDYNTVNKKGASVIADAVNLLSNAWNGSKTSTSGLPTASNTTYNCAMVTGNKPSAVGSYNGGLENLPRFHEKWSGIDCNIRGSFVNAWESRYATGAWKYGGKRYEAPRRLWDYDAAFNDVANLPPYTPMAVTTVDVVVW